MDDCLFCKINNGDIPADILYQDDKVTVFRDINPQAPLHALVIPRKHISTLNDLTPEDYELVGYMVHVASQVAAEQGMAEDGFRTVFNCNAYGGQTVFHIHLHLLAGKPLGWPPYQETLKVDV